MDGWMNKLPINALIHHLSLYWEDKKASESRKILDLIGTDKSVKDLDEWHAYCLNYSLPLSLPPPSLKPCQGKGYL